MFATRTCSWIVLALVAGCGRFGFDEAASTWVFTDEEQATFELGDFSAGTSWSGDQVQLAGAPPFDPATIGIYVSRPFETHSSSTVWDTLAWVPDAPYGRPLPDAGGSDTGYAEGASMAANILLLHLDGAASATNGDTVTDSSGSGHHGEVVLAGQGAAHIAGQFAQALDLDRDAWVTLDGNYFDLGTGDFTYSVWVKMYACSESNDNRVALGGGGAGDAPHMWIGALCPDACNGNDGAFMNFLDSSRNGPSLNACTGVVLEDGGWHHLAGVKRGHTAPAATVRLFVDGREVSADSYDFGVNSFTYDGGEIRLGGFNLGGTQYNTRIVVDEAAIWKRALSETEVSALHRRGTSRLELQIRICPDRTCDGEPFIGPDGTSSSYFTEADLVGAAGDQRGNLVPLGLVGSVAQYRVRFSTASPTTSPGLRRVTLVATPP